MHASCMSRETQSLKIFSSSRALYNLSISTQHTSDDVNVIFNFDDRTYLNSAQYLQVETRKLPLNNQ